MRETPQFIYIYLYKMNVVKNYLLSLNLMVKMLFTFQLFYLNAILNVNLVIEG